MAADRQTLEAERDRLKQLLAVREGRPGYTANVREIRKRLAQVETELAHA